MADRHYLWSCGELACLAELWPQHRWRSSAGKKSKNLEVDTWKAWAHTENKDRQIKNEKEIDCRTMTLEDVLCTKNVQHYITTVVFKY